MALGLLFADSAAAGPPVLDAETHRDHWIAVPAWDPASPQRLVRLGGGLHQLEAGRLYPVSPDRISARLAEGVGSWEELVDRAIADAPATFSVLDQLEALRTNRLGIVDLALPRGSDPVAWCELVHLTGRVRYAEVVSLGEYVATVNDPRYPDQWGLRNTGQTGGIPGSDIDIERAWDLTAGSSSVVVAVLDSGTDVDHLDLAANVWHNPGETPGNGVDDDGNGYVDDWEGWDFDQNDNDPRSFDPHGTQVTGVVNAVGNNGLGVAGVAGGLGGGGVLGMALNVGNNGPNAGVVDDAILYAADNGADVITMSLSIGSSQAINDALDYAYHTKDVFIDCASGNNGASVAYPATRPEVMAVAATGDDDTRSWFSNPGPEVEVAAPGSDIWTTSLNDGYAAVDGTSFAAPAVAGLAALIRGRNPAMPAADVRQLIVDTAEDVESPGFDELTGHGRVNAYEAVLQAANSDGAIAFGAAAYGCQATLSVTVSDIDLAGSGSMSIPVTSDAEPAGETALLTETGAGTGVFRGTLDTDTGPATADGVLQVADGDSAVAEYLDADDGQGGTNVLKTASAGIDCSPPFISDVDTLGISDVATDVVWTTDEGGSSLVRYGTTVPPTTEQSRPGLVEQHSVSLAGLQECTTYFYEVESEDAAGNLALDQNGGAYFRFETYRNLPETGPVPCHQGQILFDRSEPYGCGDTVTVTVIDIDLDTDPGVAETVDILLTSSTEPEGEWITLTEIALSNSRFQGTIELDAGGPVPADGRLAVDDGDHVTATYHDADDGISGYYVASATATTDCVAPSIDDVQVVQITATRAVVQWTTDEPATSRVEFGGSAALGSIAEQTALVTSHSVPISAFDACQRAFFRVSSTDGRGETRVADAAGAPFELNTHQIGGLVYHESFETDTGWTLTGEWERGTPAGLGTPGADPTGAWDGTFAIGNDLSGQGSFAGDYEPSASESATSPTFSTRQERDLELIIRRKLGIRSADEVGVYILTNGTNQVWASGNTFNDADWFQQRFDISAVADNKSSVQIEFRLDSFNADHSYGWNIDEVIVKDSTAPDYLVCGGCAGPPSFGGVTAVSDPDPCAGGGLAVAWDPAPAWGSGSGGTYEVHRGTTADFTPSAANRVATGLTGTSWTDTSAPVDTPVWYVVRARNDESCSADGGLTDDNLARIGATETTSQPLPAPVGDTLTVRTVGDAHVRLEWMPAAGADRYRVRRATQADFSDAVEIGTTRDVLFEDVDAVQQPGLFAYRVASVDACGREE